MSLYSLEHGFSLAVAKQNLQVRTEVFSMDLQHGNVSSAVHLSHHYKLTRQVEIDQIKSLREFLEKEVLKKLASNPVMTGNGLTGVWMQATP